MAGLRCRGGGELRGVKAGNVGGEGGVRVKEGVGSGSG